MVGPPWTSPHSKGTRWAALLLALLCAVGVRLGSSGEAYCCPRGSGKKGNCKAAEGSFGDICDDDPCYGTCLTKEACWGDAVCTGKCIGKDCEGRCHSKGPSTWCKRKDKAVCRGVSPAQHSTPCEESDQGKPCEVTCAEGYVAAAGGPSSATYTCSALGTWALTGAKQELVCARQCAALPPTEHLDFGGCGTPVEGRTCDVGCENGYANANANANSEQEVQYVCGSDGNWQPSNKHQPPSCEKLVCDATAPTEHAQPCPTETSYAGGTCKVYCAEGYMNGPGSGDGVLEFVCSAQGQWKAAPGGTCVKLEGKGSCCPSASECDDCAFATDECPSKEKCLSTAAGSHSEGGGCNQPGQPTNGSFGGNATWCVGGTPTNCPVAGPTVAHASATGSCHYDQGSRCTIKCDAGYVGEQDEDDSQGLEYACANGQWRASGRELTCHKGCAAKVDIVSAHHNCTDARVGSRCVAQCDEGFVNAADDETASMANETLQYVCDAVEHGWKVATPGQGIDCRPVTCPAGPPVSNANSCEDDAAGELCSVTCLEGYNNTASLNNTMLRYVCQKDGPWIPKPDVAHSLAPPIGGWKCANCTAFPEQCFSGPGKPPFSPGEDGGDKPGGMDEEERHTLFVVGVGAALLLVLLLCLCLHLHRHRTRKHADQTAAQVPALAWGLLLLSCSALPVLAVVIAWPKDTSLHWQVACVAVTLSSKMPLLRIIPEFKRTLHQLPDLDMDEDQRSAGFFGLGMFIWGVIDCVRGPLFLALPLFRCKQWVLFSCSVLTLLMTTVTTVHLAYVWIDRVAASSPESKRWLVKNGKPVALVVAAASSRLDMLSIFRLRLCGLSLTALPMESRYFHFVQNAGMYHHLIEDLPHGLVGIAAIYVRTCNNTDNLFLEKMTGWAWLPDDTTFSAVTSICSIAFGLLNKSMQLRISTAGQVTARQFSLRESLLGSSRLSVSELLGDMSAEQGGGIGGSE